jgi:heme/copper-type cytochrome/quinol oxidase subunit 2
MPVEVHAVTKAQFKAWIDAKKIEKDGGIEAKSPYQQITLTQ